MIYDKDADLSKLDGKTVAILGYGSQGHAHALNLKDSGVNVVVGLREDSSSVDKAKADGLRVTSIADAASEGDVVMVLLPDEKQAEVLESEIRDGIAPGNLLMFAHGFSIHFGQIDPGRRWMWGWPLRRAPATWCAASTWRGTACPVSWRCTRTRPAPRASSCSPTRAASAARGRG